MARRYDGNAIQVIQGGLYGSEAKGSVAAWLAQRDDIDICCRTGATNAGHTVYRQRTVSVDVTPHQDPPGSLIITAPTREYDKFVMQSLPCGWVHPHTFLIIGAGALIDPDILKREITDIQTRTGEDIRKRLLVDYRAYLHWHHHATHSKQSGRHELIGATGKGCSEAIIARLRLRGQDDHRIGAMADKLGMDLPIGDTEEYLNRQWDKGAKIQLEGTQGQLLDLALGPYPYTTHKQTGPAQWLLECGLSPSLPTDIVIVVRTYPIRVAGNSGPLPLEISWPRLAVNINEARIKADMDPIVAHEAILEFMNSLAAVACGGEFRLPPGRSGVDQHEWSAEERLEYRDALSWCNARAMEALPEATRNELAKLFEMTTVTKKLRRVAELDLDTLRLSVRQCRPHRVVVTFLNYLFPTRWGCDAPITDSERTVLDQISVACGAPVVAVNRGPLPSHFVEVPEPVSQPCVPGGYHFSGDFKV